MLMKAKGSPFHIFWHYATFSERKNSKIQVFSKKVFCAFGALDIAPTLDVPVLSEIVVKVTKSCFEQNWDFNVYPIFVRFTQSTFASFFTRLTSPNLLKLWTYFDFENDQISKYHDQKVKFRRFTCIKMRN